MKAELVTAKADLAQMTRHRDVALESLDASMAENTRIRGLVADAKSTLEGV